MADINGNGSDMEGPYYPSTPAVQPNDRQGIKMDPSDTAHLTTHRPPETDFNYAGRPSNMSIQPGKKSD